MSNSKKIQESRDAEKALKSIRLQLKLNEIEGKTDDEKAPKAIRLKKDGTPFKSNPGKRRSKEELRKTKEGRLVELYQTVHTVIGKANKFQGTVLEEHTTTTWGGDEYAATKKGGAIEKHYDEILPFALAAIADAKANEYSASVIAFIDKVHSFKGHGGGKGGGKKTVAGIQDLVL